MGNSKTNMSFFKAYIELDKACADRLGVEKHGVSAYISNLVEMRYATGRNEVLSRLIKYRKFRNAMAHEKNAFNEVDEITKSDIQWMTRFQKSLSKKRDPVSRYNRKAGFYSLWRKIRIPVYVLAAAAISLAIYFIIAYYTKNIIK